jgi:hypothetical protein
MNNSYKIRGADGQEYGPAGSDQIRQWITEGRVDQKTPVLVTGASDWTALDSVPELAARFTPSTPPVISAAAAKPQSGGGLNVIIPYKNVRALTAYYLGVFSAIPILGMPLGLAAFILGILALRFRRKNPAAGGVVHAWIGILAGGFFGLVYLALIILGLCAIIGQRSHTHH